MTGTRTETIPLVDDSELPVTFAEPDGAVRGGVVVLHEARGVTDRMEAIVSALAGEGWLAGAPPLYHRVNEPADAGTDHPADAAALLDAASVLADSDASFGWLADHGVSSDLM